MEKKGEKGLTIVLHTCIIFKHFSWGARFGQRDADTELRGKPRKCWFFAPATGSDEEHFSTGKRVDSASYLLKAESWTSTMCVAPWKWNNEQNSLQTRGYGSGASALQSPSELRTGQRTNTLENYLSLSNFKRSNSYNELKVLLRQRSRQTALNRAKKWANNTL